MKFSAPAALLSFLAGMALVVVGAETQSCFGEEDYGCKEGKDLVCLEHLGHYYQECMDDKKIEKVLLGNPSKKKKRGKKKKRVKTFVACGCCSESDDPVVHSALLDGGVKLNFGKSAKSAGPKCAGLSTSPTSSPTASIVPRIAEPTGFTPSSFPTINCPDYIPQITLTASQSEDFGPISLQTNYEGDTCNWSGGGLDSTCSNSNCFGQIVQAPDSKTEFCVQVRLVPEGVLDYCGESGSITACTTVEAASSTPSLGPSPTPSNTPSLAPSSGPSLAPSSAPSSSPSLAPSIAPSSGPSLAPSSGPSLAPSSGPSLAPSSGPSLAPSSAPSSGPSLAPSSGPSSAPSSGPSLAPSSAPSSGPSLAPSSDPSSAPSSGPSLTPSSAPSSGPSLAPSSGPSLAPSTSAPSSGPSLTPSSTPSISVAPSLAPSTVPSTLPSSTPSVPPTYDPATCHTGTVVAVNAWCNGHSDPDDKCCQGTDACAQWAGTATVCKGSCLMDYSCKYLGKNAIIGPGSCRNGKSACTNVGYSKGTSIHIGSNSCLGYGACYQTGGSNAQSIHIASNACIGTAPCHTLGLNQATQITVGSNACVGDNVCKADDVPGHLVCNTGNTCPSIPPV